MLAHAQYARAVIAEQVRRLGRQLTLVYGVALPKIDGEEIAMDRLLEMVQKETDDPPLGYPEVSEDAAYEGQLMSPSGIMGGYRGMKQGMRRGYEKPAEVDGGYDYIPCEDVLTDY